MSTRKRMRNVCFTAWLTHEKYTEIVYDKEYMTYLVMGKEICPKTKKLHWQGYVEFVRALDFAVVKRLLGGDTTKVAKRGGTGPQASIYCKKDNKFEEYGEIKEQGKRTDISEATDMIKDGASMRDVALDHTEVFVKYHSGLGKLKNLLIEPRNWVTNVTVLYGKTGTGKSRQARELCSDYWVWTPQRGSWFDGYEGHHDVIMEEFRGQLPLGMLLSMLDRYECPVQVKGGMVEFAPHHVVITSPKHPKDWYEDISDDKIEQLLRRITNVTHVTEVAGNTKQQLVTS